MKELSEKLLRAVEIAEPTLRKVSEAESNIPVLKDGWSRKQVIGHLIDSASNNHQRFVRAALQGSLEFPATIRTALCACKLLKARPGPS
jgi:hypothetical protein